MDDLFRRYVIGRSRNRHWTLRDIQQNTGLYIVVAGSVYDCILLTHRMPDHIPWFMEYKGRDATLDILHLPGHDNLLQTLQPFKVGRYAEPDLSSDLTALFGVEATP